MAIDVKVETVIKRAKDEVASFAMNSDNDPVWIGGITQARALTDPPMGEGTRVERVSSFLGKRIVYVNEVTEYDPKGLLVMHSVSVPFPMKIRYQFEETVDGTLARIQIQGEAGGFYKLAGPVLARAVKRSVTKDLKRLKELLESGVQVGKEKED